MILKDIEKAAKEARREEEAAPRNRIRDMDSQSDLLERLTAQSDNSDKVYGWKTWVEGPRWMGISSFVRVLCFELGLTCSIEEDKGILRTLYFIELEGDKDKLESFIKEWERFKVEYTS